MIISPKKRIDILNKYYKNNSIFCNDILYRTDIISIYEMRLITVWKFYQLSQGQKVIS